MGVRNIYKLEIKNCPRRIGRQVEGGERWVQSFGPILLKSFPQNGLPYIIKII